MRLGVAVRDCGGGAFSANDRRSRYCDFHGVLSVGGLGATFSLVVTAAQDADCVSGEATIWLGEIIGQQESLTDTPLVSAMAPISVTCLGRTGSTLMMRILGAHPEIVVAGGYPHETRYAQDAFRDMGDRLDAVHRDAALGGQDTKPDRRSMTAIRRELLRPMCRMVDHFYKRVAMTQQKPAARLFSEKCLPSFLPNVARDVYGPRAKEIMIVRDPRDIFCSAASFNKKRSSLAFGAESHEDDMTWFRFIRHCFLQIAEAPMRRTEALTVRYEDLILDQRQTITRILRFLNVFDSGAVVDAIEARLSRPETEFVNHMTSASSRESIARWRFHRDRDMFEAGDPRYRRAMRAFGYV